MLVVHPVTWTFVLCFRTAPFCATISVGMTRLGGCTVRVVTVFLTVCPLMRRVTLRFAVTVCVSEQRVAVRRERGVLALGEIELERADGDIGDGLERAERDPRLADERAPVKSTRDTIALQHDDQARERFPAVGDEIHRAGTGPTGSSGVLALTIPTIDAAGHSAGFASNVCAVHAFCSVVSREGSCLGSSTLTCAMFASLPTDPAG